MSEHVFHVHCHLFAEQQLSILNVNFDRQFSTAVCGGKTLNNCLDANCPVGSGLPGLLLELTWDFLPTPTPCRTELTNHLVRPYFQHDSFVIFELDFIKNRLLTPLFQYYSLYLTRQRLTILLSTLQPPVPELLPVSTR